MTQRLEWVQRNRASGSRSLRAGALVRGLASGLQRESESAAAEWTRLIQPLVDDEFRAHCRIDPAGGSVVAVCVDHPTLVAVMRRRWLGPVKRALGQWKGTPRIREVVFRYGTTGISLPAAGRC